MRACNPSSQILAADMTSWDSNTQGDRSREKLLYAPLWKFDSRISMLIKTWHTPLVCHCSMLEISFIPIGMKIVKGREEIEWKRKRFRLNAGLDCTIHPVNCHVAFYQTELYNQLTNEEFFWDFLGVFITKDYIVIHGLIKCKARTNTKKNKI